MAITIDPNSLENKKLLKPKEIVDLTSYDVSGLEQPTPQANKVDDLTTRFANINKKLLGETQYTSEQEKLAGIPQQEETMSDLGVRLRDLQKQALAIPIQIQKEYEGRGVTKRGIAPIERGRLRENAIQALTTSSLIDASQNRLTSAQAKVDRAVKEKFGTLKDEKNAIIDNINMLIKSGTLNREETKRAEATKARIAKEKSKLDADEQEQKEIWNIATQVAPQISSLTNGSVILDQIQKSKTKEEALRLASEAGAFIPAPLTELERAKIATEKARAEKLRRAISDIPDEPLSINQIDTFRRSYGWTPPFGFTESQLLQYMKDNKDNPNATPEALEAGAKQILQGKQPTDTTKEAPTTTPDEVITSIMDTMSDEQLKALKTKADEAGISSMWRGKRTDVKNYLESITDIIKGAIERGYSVDEIIERLTK